MDGHSESPSNRVKIAQRAGANCADHCPVGPNGFPAAFSGVHQGLDGQPCFLAKCSNGDVFSLHQPGDIALHEESLESLFKSIRTWLTSLF